MVRKIDWDSQIGRRLRLRDLHVFCTILQHGSMAKAAAALGVSQPAVSQIVADLEHALGVKLLERSVHGTGPTIYGSALLKRSLAAFDELKQGIRDIEALNDPTSGEIVVGSPTPVTTTFLPPIIRSFNLQYPRVLLRVEDVLSPAQDVYALRRRTQDLVVARVTDKVIREADDLKFETLFYEDLVLAAGSTNKVAKRRNIRLDELVTEPWILPPQDSWSYGRLAHAFLAVGLSMPAASLMIGSVMMRAQLLVKSPYVTVFPRPLLQLYSKRFDLHELPIDLQDDPLPVTVITLKNRVLNPSAERFVEHLRKVTRTIGTTSRQRSQAARSR